MRQQLQKYLFVISFDFIRINYESMVASIFDEETSIAIAIQHFSTKSGSITTPFQVESTQHILIQLINTVNVYGLKSYFILFAV